MVVLMEKIKVIGPGKSVIGGVAIEDKFYQVELLKREDLKKD
jgi:hypothetical protein